jgi:hypothetical protein
MRRTFIPLILSVFMLAYSSPAIGVANGQTAPAFEVAGTDAAHASAFLKTLQSAVSVGNCLKVASLVEFPLRAWANGGPITIQSESEFHAKYRQVFTPGLKKAIAAARPETLSANQEGVMFDNGRVCFRPVAADKNALRVVAINEGAQTR